MIINLIYEQKLIAAIKDAPDACLEEPASVTRKAFLDNAGAIEDAAISFQKDYEEYDCDYDWAMKEALKQIGLKRLELIFGDEKGVSDAGVLH